MSGCCVQARSVYSTQADPWGPFPCAALSHRSIDALNRERKLQQSAAGSELRVLEDQYYSALRKNLEISAACQAVEDDMVLLQARVDKLAGPKGEGDGAAQEQQQDGQQEGQKPLQNGVAAAAADEQPTVDAMEEGQ